MKITFKGFSIIFIVSILNMCLLGFSFSARATEKKLKKRKYHASLILKKKYRAPKDHQSSRGRDNFLLQPGLIDARAQKLPEIFKIKRVNYTVKPGDTLSKVLFDLGIGQNGATFNLWGNSNWVRHQRMLNPTIVDWNRLVPGTSLVLEIPFEEKKLETKSKLTVVEPWWKKDSSSGM